MRWQDKLNVPCHNDTIQFIEHVESQGTTTVGELRQWFKEHYSYYPVSSPLQLDNQFGMYFNIMDSLRLARVEPEYSEDPSALVIWDEEIDNG